LLFLALGRTKNIYFYKKLFETVRDTLVQLYICTSRPNTFLWKKQLQGMAKTPSVHSVLLKEFKGLNISRQIALGLIFLPSLIFGWIWPNIIAVKSRIQYNKTRYIIVKTLLIFVTGKPKHTCQTTLLWDQHTRLWPNKYSSKFKLSQIISNF